MISLSLHLYYLLFSCFWVYTPTINLSSNNSNIKLFEIFGKAQGTSYSIKYLNTDSSISKADIDNILNAIDKSLSLYEPNSLISIFNRSNKGVNSDIFLKDVVLKSIYFANLSNGYFDITCKPLSELWGFGKNNVFVNPSYNQIKKALFLVGSNNLFFRNDSLLKMKPLVKIDCDGIAQGYSVDVIFKFLQENNINNFIVELGGEIRSFGYNLNNLPWIVGIEDPTKFIDNEFLVSRHINITNKAITTSGSYRKFKKIGNQYFSHIINPKKGRPINNGIISATVIADDAITADGLDNIFMILSVKESFDLLKLLPDIGLYIIYKNKNEQLRDTSNLIFKKYIKD